MTVAATGEATRLQRVADSFRAMGTLFEVVLLHEDEGLLHALLNEIHDEVARLEAKLSRFLPTSEVSRINRLAGRGPILVDFEMLEILDAALEYYRKTSGAFDITVAPLLRKWGLYERRGRAVDAQTLRQLLDQVGSDLIELDRRRRTVAFKRPGVEIDLGAVGKGYAVREVVDMLRQAGLQHAFVSFGGSSIFALGSAPGHDGWPFSIRLAPPELLEPVPVTLQNRSLTISGNTVRTVEAGGRSVGHVLNPASGQPAADVVAVAIVHDSPFVGEMLSTAMMVLGPEKGEEILARERAGALFAVRSADGVELRDVNFTEV